MLNAANPYFSGSLRLITSAVIEAWKCANQIDRSLGLLPCWWQFSTFLSSEHTQMAEQARVISHLKQQAGCIVVGLCSACIKTCVENGDCAWDVDTRSVAYPVCHTVYCHIVTKRLLPVSVLKCTAAIIDNILCVLAGACPFGHNSCCNTHAVASQARWQIPFQVFATLQEWQHNLQLYQVAIRTCLVD